MSPQDITMGNDITQNSTPYHKPPDHDVSEDIRYSVRFDRVLKRGEKLLDHITKNSRVEA